MKEFKSSGVIWKGKNEKRQAGSSEHQILHLAVTLPFHHQADLVPPEREISVGEFPLLFEKEQSYWS